MKKILSLILVLAMFATMNIGVGAADPSNTRFSTAINFSFDEKVTVMSNEIGFSDTYMLYYKFTVPYEGMVDIDISAYCTQIDDYKYVYMYYKFFLYNSSENKLSEIDFNPQNTHKSGTTYRVGEFQLELPAGVYYLVWDQRSSVNQDFIYRFSWTASFKCSHTSTSTQTTVEPTCSSTGKEVTTCNNCKETVSTDTISKLPHTPADEWVKVSDPTCAKAGEEQKACTVCGGVAEKQSIDKLPHTYGDWTTVTEPTCSKEGKRERVCSACNDKETESIDKLDHVFGKWETTTEPTCTKKGNETRKCENCGKSESNSLDMLEHSFGKWEETTEATCTSKGKAVRECSTCGKEETKTLDMLDHSFGKWEVYTNASCTSTGTERRYCKLCNKYESRTIDKTDHEYEDYSIVRQPTCTNKGEERGYCENCGKTITEDIPMLDHNYGAWTVTTAPTCAKVGKETATCKDCGKSASKTISMLDHNFGEWTVTKEPTCSKEGSQTHKCTSCGKSETKSVEKAPHTIEEWTITKEATETRKGTRKGKCTVCGKTVSEDYNKYPGRNGFKKSRNYGAKFSDVGNDKWFHEYVQTAYEYSLANGTSETSFSPDSKFTVAQALTAAANIHCAYYGNTVGSANSGEAWYVPYVNYCIENGIIKEGQFKDYNKNIKRGEMAQIFANVLPTEEYTSVRSGSPTDMSTDMASYAAVTKLYGAGIVSGDAGTGKFRPDDEIVRSEACVIFTRIAVDSYRAK